MALLRKVTGVGADDDRLIGVELDLTRTASIASAARSIKAAAGVSDSLVHNAGISAGMVEVGQVFRSPTSVPVLFSMRSGACSQASGVLRAH
jgi:NAD(P)-dependent dehydrogenase (short-subunit alcohol dehydrogenase family)